MEDLGKGASHTSQSRAKKRAINTDRKELLNSTPQAEQVGSQQSPIRIITKFGSQWEQVKKCPYPTLAHPA